MNHRNSIDKDGVYGAHTVVDQAGESIPNYSFLRGDSLLQARQEALLGLYVDLTND